MLRSLQCAAHAQERPIRHGLEFQAGLLGKGWSAESGCMLHDGQTRIKGMNAATVCTP